MVNKKHFVISLLFLAIFTAVFLGWRNFHKNMVSFAFFSIFYPNLITSERLLQNLSSSNDELLSETIGFMHNKRDCRFKDDVMPFLLHDSFAVWTLSAYYLGRCGDDLAVGYIIKSMNGRFPRDSLERRELISRVTGEDFGDDFEKWKTWWEGRYPDYVIDWDSNLGFRR